MTSKGPFQPKTFYDSMILRLSRAASAVARGCSQGSPAASLFPDALGFRDLGQRDCAGEGPGEDYPPQPLSGRQTHGGGTEPGTLQPDHLLHVPVQRSRDAQGFGASGLWHLLPALTLSALLPPSPRPGTTLEWTSMALFATETSTSRSWDGCWDVSSSSSLPAKP